MCAVKQEHLIALFAGEMDEGEWLTTPCYTVPLCVEIARHVRPTSEVRLRWVIYGEGRPAEAVPEMALEVIGLGFKRWQQLATTNRGL